MLFKSRFNSRYPVEFGKFPRKHFQSPLKNQARLKGENYSSIDVLVGIWCCGFV
jgi:hypothetical protein